MQEFTAALYALSCTQEEHATVVSQIANLDWDTFRSLSLFIKFTFGVACAKRRNGDVADDKRNMCSVILFKSTVCLESESLDKYTRKGVYRMMFEVCIENKSLLCEILDNAHRFQYLLAAFDVKPYFTKHYDSPDYHYVLSALVTQDIIEKLLDHGVHIDMGELFENGNPNMSDEEMSALIPFINSFHSDSAKLGSAELNTLIQAYDITSIELSQCKFQNQTSLCEILSFIHQLPKLHTLRVCRPVISETGNRPHSDTDINSIFRGNQPLPIQVLDLPGCPETLTLLYLQEIVPLCKQLACLALSCDTSQDLHFIFSNLPSSLKELQLTGSGLTRENVVTLLNNIGKLKRLDWLSLCGMEITITDIKISQEFTKVLCYGEKPYYNDLRQLSLDLSQYCIDLDVILQTLSKLNHRLDFNLTGLLIDNQMCHNIKSTAASIVGINMRACRLGDLNEENIRETWESLKLLTSLDVSMMKDQAGHLDQIISMMPNLLEVLDISDSDISEESLKYLTDFVRRKHFKKFEASGVSIEHEKETSYEVSIYLHDCTKFTNQILGHCLSKLHVSMLKLSGTNKDSLINTEITQTLMHDLLSLNRLSLSKCDTRPLKDFIMYLYNSTQLRELNLSENSLEHVESEFSHFYIHSPLLWKY